MEKLTRLFEPITIGRMEVRNRIVMTGFAFTSVEDTSQLGVTHQRYIDFFEERAKGGVGLIILPDTVIDRNLRFMSHPCIGGDEFNPGLSALTEAVHTWGAKIAPDLWYSDSLYRHIPGWRPPFPYGSDWTPLETAPANFRAQRVIEMSATSIHEVEALYADAASRAQRTGFDALQLAGHFGFFISQFLSPLFNHRTDEYGGSLENRMRVVLEIIGKIRDRIGDALPIIVRMGADELVEGGITLEESSVIARRLEQAGVDALNIIGGLCAPGEFHKNIAPMGSPQGTFVEMASRIKREVRIPVIVAGRITDPQFAEKVITEGKTDMVGMARQLAADPEWPLKASAGRFSSITPCLGCNECLERLSSRVSRCSVNPSLGREREFHLVPAARRRRVLVAGAGPAGLMASIVAARRGHEVILYEKGEAPGGQLLLAARPPYKMEIGKYLGFLVEEAQNAGVHVVTGVEVSPGVAVEAGPDAVIVATGARPLMPGLPGAESAHVLTAWDVLAGAATGRRVVVVGGGMVGCETAEYLVHHGCKVTILEALPEIALDMERSTRRRVLLERFAIYDLRVFTSCNVKAIISKGLLVGPGDDRVVEADTVVLAVGSVPDASLARALRNTVPQLHMVGDCVRPGRIVDAVNQAAYVARQL